MHRLFLLRMLTLGALLVGTSAAQAGLIEYTYSWEVTPADGKVYAQTGNQGGHILMTNEGPTDASGASTIVASNLKVVSGANPTSPDTFAPTEGHYDLTITLTDKATGISGSLTFTGQFQGSFSSMSANVTNTFTNSAIQTIKLGDNIYMVNLDTFTPPGPPNAINLGSISGYIDVVREVPEPASLAMAGLGAGMAGLMAWRKRRTAV